MKSQKKIEKIKSYFVKALENDWLEDSEDIIEVVKKEKKVDKIEKVDLEINNNYDNNLFYNKYLDLNFLEKTEIEEIVKENYIKKAGSNNKIVMMAFEQAKRKLIIEYLKNIDYFSSKNKLVNEIENLKINTSTAGLVNIEREFNDTLDFKFQVFENLNNKFSTTSALNLIGFFAKNNYKVLAIDLDPQGNLTDAFGVDLESLETTAYDALKEKNISNYLLNINENIDLLPSNLNVEKANLDFVSILGRELLLKKGLVKIEEKYDICIIDTSPNLSTLTLNALSCADSVYIPLRSGYFEMRGASVLLEVIENIKEDINPLLKIGGVFLTQYDSRINMANEVIEQLENYFGDKLMKTKVRNNISLVEAPALMKNIFDYKPSSNGAKDYEKLGEEIIIREQL